MVREPKRGKRGRGRGRKEPLADKPLDLELAIGWDSRILLTCVDQKTQTSEAFEGCLQKIFQIRSPPPPLSFVFWLSPHFSRGKNTENPVPRSFFAPKPHGNACYAG